jgi:hypothetical protein
MICSAAALFEEANDQFGGIVRKPVPSGMD